MGEEMKRMVNDPAYVDSVLHEGAGRARATAEPILAEVYDIVGFLRP
jgi:tryptophanyl-tRNA synthetase